MKKKFTASITYLVILLIAFGCNSDFMTDDFDDLSQKIKEKEIKSVDVDPSNVGPGTVTDPGNGGTENLVCGTSMAAGFQCIKSSTGASTTTTYNIKELIGSWDSKDFDFCVSYASNGTGVITYKASGFSPGSVQNIKWGAMVNSKGELLKSNAGTIYVVHQSTGSTPVDSQIALLSFKQSTKQWFGFDLVSVASCGSVVAAAKGTIMVWTSVPKNGFPYGYNVMTVNISTIAGFGYVDGGYYTTAPSCGSQYCYTREIAPGQHQVSGVIYYIKPLVGETPPTYKKSKTVTVYANQCTKVDLR